MNIKATITVATPYKAVELELSELVGPWLDVELDKDEIVEALQSMSTADILDLVGTEDAAEFVEANYEEAPEEAVKLFSPGFIIALYNALPDIAKLAAVAVEEKELTC